MWGEGGQSEPTGYRPSEQRWSKSTTRKLEQIRWPSTEAAAILPQF